MSTRFIPSEFWWQTTYKEPQKVQEVCDILNTLTPTQIEAVNYYVRDQRIQAEIESDSENEN